MTTVRGTLAAFCDRHAGGLLPVPFAERAVSMSDGTQYNLGITLFRRTFRFGYDTPNPPRSVRRARAAEAARLAEHSRRVDAGEPLVQAGDHIPGHATGKLAACLEVRDSDFTVWKRAVGAERYARDEDGHLNRGQKYDWIAWCAGQWGGGWTTTGGLLDSAPLTVLKTIDPPPPEQQRSSQR